MATHLTTREVAALMEITPETVRVYVHQGRLQVIGRSGKSSLYTRGDVHRLMRERGRPGRGRRKKRKTT